MLGPEYNWLVKITPTTEGVTTISLRKSGLFTLGVAIFCFLCAALHADSPRTRESVVLNVRILGATGDGRIHLVREWIDQGRFRSMRELQRTCPVIQSADWSVDEAAFELAKAQLPVGGGTIYFPEGRYVAAHRSWTVTKDNVRLLGDGADRSVLLTALGIDDTLVLSPYRHIGWLLNASDQFPFQADSGRRGANGVTLLDATWTGEFRPGDLVFVRNGACRFDQDYGEFNEIAGVDAKGSLRFKYPLSRDYTLERINWAGTAAGGFKVPKINRSVTVATVAGEGNFQPRKGDAITAGGQLFEVIESGKTSLRLRNPGRGNDPPGTTISAGTHIALSRAIIKVTQSTRNFRAEKLQFVGQRKVLNLSNSYGMEFIDCRFLRQPTANHDTKGGLTIDGDGGRFARFTRCTLQANPPWAMQFARSFGGVTFDDCTFSDANVAFTEFCFDCAVTNCVFDFHGPSPAAVIIVGKSGGDFRILDNRIKSENTAAVFDSQFDIQSQKHRGEGGFIIRGNTIATTGKTQVFRLNSDLPTTLGDNHVTTE
ncbi:MAG TPA: hypothetical protein VGM64_21525 [Lacunisphaera sp.]|jgi:hypothetical protein